ncbi:DciA family protein [Acetonema longum]|uniref:DciA family protein n=1 Tax=Acetonema longum TaxID=2374 RepID=UPI0002F58F6A|nr:DUF721 domain-containing protein [Acetonema longum]
MHSLKDILSGTLKQIGIKEKYNSQSVIVHWGSIVGQDIASQAYPTHVRNQILFVAASSPVWAHHLSMMKEQILEKIRQFTGQKQVSIKDIRFHAGKLPALQEFQNRENSGQDLEIRQKLRCIQLDRENLSQIQDMITVIKDQELRSRVERILLKEWKWKKVKQQESYHPCRQCGALCPPENVCCTVCMIDQKQKKRGKIREILSQLPWMEYTECRKYIECDFFEFIQAKHELIQSLTVQLEQNPDNQVKLSALAMLIYRVEPASLSGETLEKTLKYINRMGKYHLPAVRPSQNASAPQK